MSAKIAYIISLKYAPGLWKEFHLIGRNLSENGFDVKYLLSNGYQWMIREDIKRDVVFISTSQNIKEMIYDFVCYPLRTREQIKDIFGSAPPDFLCIYNPHPLNASILKQAESYASESRRLIFLHEPYRSDKSAYSWKGRLIFHIVELTQKIAIAHTTDMILPSPLGMKLFDEYFPDYPGRKHYAPIIIPDQPYQGGQKRYFSFVGRINFAKSLDVFIDTVNYSAERDEDLEFQVVTASPVDKYLDRLTDAGKSKLYIVRKNEISEEDINKCVAESFAVLALQPVITQSGVVPVSFMNSTPVIARAIPGFSQFVKHKENGWLLPEDFSIDQLVEAMKSVRQNIDLLSKNARQSYLELFAEKNWGFHYSWLMKELSYR